MNNWVAFQTLATKEIKRFLRIWVQTIVPPTITVSLYFIIFGKLVGSQIGDIEGVTYMQFITPGLIMMSIVTSAYFNTVSSVYGNKFQNSIEELLISSMSTLSILFGFMIGGIMRGLFVGALVSIVALFFSGLSIHHLWVIIGVAILTATLFSLAGLLNGLFANSWDSISIIPTFVLTPLLYLGGIFYSIQMLSPFWRSISNFNPMLYIVNSFRYGVIGITDISINYAVTIIFMTTISLFAICYVLLKRGIGLRE